MNQPQQPNKKPGQSPNSSSAKIENAASAGAQQAVNKMSQTAYSAAETARKSTQNVVNIGASAMRDMLSGSSTSVRDTQERIQEMGREGVQNLAKSADMCSRLMTEMVSITRDNMDACIEASTITSGVAKNIGEEVMETCNRAFSESVELSKEAFNCRTLNDMLELQSKAVKSFMDLYFNQSSRLCNMAFECCTDAMEPINQRVTDASEQLSKAMAA